MDIRDRLVGDVGIVELAGRLTVNDDPGPLKQAVVDIVSRGAKNVLLDLSGVHYIDSTRLGELIAAHITVSRNGGRLKLVNVPPRVVELLTLAGLDDIFERLRSDRRRREELSPEPRRRLCPFGRGLGLTAAQFAIQIEQRRRIVLHHVELRDDLAHGLFFLDLLGDEPLQLGHRGEDLLAERQFVEPSICLLTSCSCASARSKTSTTDLKSLCG